jgi:hypothetical protein
MKKEEKASALIIALLVIFLIAASIAVAMQLTTTTLRQTDSSRDFSALRGATEGALDFAYGTWTKTINNYFRPVSKTELAPSMVTVPAFSGFSYAPLSENGPLQITPVNRYGEPSDAAVYTLLNLDNYPGWTGKNYGYVASARLTGTFAGGRTVKYGAKRAINYSVVPLFQATAFFEDNLELYKTAPMTIGGLVHTNSHAYVSSSSPESGGSPSLAFSGNLSYASGYTDNQAPPQADTWSGYTPNSAYPPAYSGAGSDEQVNQVTRMEPLGADAATLLHPPVDAAGNPTGDTNPNDDSIRELIELRDPNPAYPEATPIAQRRLVNKAGIIIRVTATTTTITTQNGTTLTPAQKTALGNALSRQTIYDRREGKDIDLTTLNVSQARTTLNAASGFNNILYIYDDTSTGYGDPKGIRLTNGGTLPTGGFTIATQNPVYIQGDYNTSANRVSSAVFADAVTILSNNWSDSRSNGALSARQATNTTVNTAIVAGFLPSGWTNPVTGAQYGYSGGLNNFPRFLETWSNDTFTYTGSMIELFTSKIATGEWDTGSIYSPPTRVWNFDSNFVDNPPPGSLDAVSIGRGALVRF